jgi:hypothetical protein
MRLAKAIPSNKDTAIKNLNLIFERTALMFARLLRIATAVGLVLATRAWAQLDFGPYVQNTDDKKATVIWYTKTSEAGVLRYGKQAGQWEGTIEGGTGTVHRAAITGLAANTKYFYEVAAGAKVYATGAQYYFRTHPRPGARTPFRFMAFGDFGDGSAAQKATAAQLLKDDDKHSFALLLGDIIYSNGERANYLRDYFPVYKDIIRHRAWWPTLGNHDIKEKKGAAYFEFFETPANNPGALENYYSFDYANAHIVSLDDELLFDGADLQKQMDWVKQDLQAAKARGQRWLIAMWHKPPYSEGTHSDDDEIQANFLPTLEAEGIDLILNGHSHVAERSYLLANHAIINNSLSNYPKKGFEAGAVYVVSGAGGKTGGVSKHKLMSFQLGDVSGYESIYINGDTLRGSWIKNSGQSMDQFTMIKTGSGQTDVQITDSEAAPENFAVHYPNPYRLGNGANAPLHLAFELTNPAAVSATIYDVLGRTVATLGDGQLFSSGRHVLQWNGRDAAGALAATGVYFYRIQAGARVHTAKLMIVQ